METEPTDQTDVKTTYGVLEEALAPLVMANLLGLRFLILVLTGLAVCIGSTDDKGPNYSTKQPPTANIPASASDSQSQGSATSTMPLTSVTTAPPTSLSTGHRQ
ncbi:hypothetical protein MHYP_G00221820 [Metynnis hypsauchen]